MNVIVMLSRCFPLIISAADDSPNMLFNLNLKSKLLKRKQKLHKAYHIVDFDALRKGKANKKDCVVEINKRVEFARAFYHGKYDKTHHRVLCNLAKNFTICDKLNLSLDSYAAVYYTKPIKRTHYKR